MFKHLMTYVYANYYIYYVSTNNTADVGLETVISKVNDVGRAEWVEIYCERHNNEAVAAKRHEYIINHIGEFIKEGEEI